MMRELNNGIYKNKLPLLLFILLLFSPKTLHKCSCQPVTVHFLPHSHCDPGYKQSTIGYFYDKVKKILDNTIQYTLENPTKKYIWVETSFLQMWWDQATDEQKNNLQTVLDRKQWEIVMGGWVMNDQACVTYSSSINQLTAGHQFVIQKLNQFPRQGFSIDPFGESPVQAAIYKSLGYDYFVMNRISVETKDLFRNKKMLQNYWTDDSFGEDMDPIFTHIMYDHYSPPELLGINFWNEYPAIDLDVISKLLVKEFKRRNESYVYTGHLLFPYGGDFSYTNPEHIYSNMDKVIQYFNNHEKYSKMFKIQYSTLSEYYDSLNIEKVEGIPKINNEDYFVYDHPSNRWWSGYFSSKPKLKILARKGENLMKETEMLYALSFLLNRGEFSEQEMRDNFKAVKQLRRKNGEIQHHDAITGTCKTVADEYYELEMDAAFLEARILNEKLVSQLVSSTMLLNNSGNAYVKKEKISFYNYGDTIGVVVVNNLGWERKDEYISVLFSKHKEFSVVVKDVSGKEYPAKVMDDGEHYKVWFIGNIPALGFKHFLLEIHSPKDYTLQKIHSTQQLESEFYSIEFDENNKVSRIKNKVSGIDMKVKMDFLFYESKHHTKHDNGDSDAYAFSPQKSEPEVISKKPSLSIVDNDLITEAHQKFSSYLEVVIRLYKQNSNFFEVEIKKLGVLPIHHEVVLRFETEINNKKTIYHDELGLEMKKKNWFTPVDEDQSVQANFYPMQYSSFIKDDKSQFTILSSKAQGVSSQKNGFIETMLHRRPGDLLETFPFINDMYVIKNYFMRFTLDTLEKSIDLRHKLTYFLNYPVAVYPFNEEYWNFKIYPTDFTSEFSYLMEELDEKIHLLSFNKNVDDQKNKEIIVRFANLYEKGEANPVEINLDSIFKEKTTKITETSLTLMKDIKKLKNNEKTSLEYLKIRTYKYNFNNTKVN